VSPLEIRPFRAEDLHAALRLWATAEGLGAGPGDSPGAVARYLERNPGLSLVAVDGGGAIVGSVLCGYDGRRGVIYRLAVAAEHRGQGLAADLVRRALAGLKAVGIERCLALVHTDNNGGRRFWETVGWKFRDDLVVYSIDLNP
jgi:ribosomal protein S18 acetylase RimI-like enzyme